MPKNINKIVQPTLSVEGDVAANIKHMLPYIKPQSRKSWFAQLDEWKSKYPFSFTPSLPGEALKPQAVIEELNRQTAHMKDRVIISTGVGQHQMWAAQYFRY